MKLRQQIANMIISIRELAELNPEQFAKQIKVTRRTVDRWEKGETTPSPEDLDKIAKKFGLGIQIDFFERGKVGA